MASINLDRKSRLKFGLSRDMQVSLYDPKLLKISMVMVTCWCWQCGIVLEPSVVAVCDFNHLGTRQSQDPIGTHIPVPTRTHRPPNSETLLKLFWKSDVSPKREAARSEFNQGHHSQVPHFWILLLWAHLIACLGEDKMPRRMVSSIRKSKCPIFKEAVLFNDYVWQYCDKKLGRPNSRCYGQFVSKQLPVVGDASIKGDSIEH